MAKKRPPVQSVCARVQPGTFAACLISTFSLVQSRRLPSQGYLASRERPRQGLDEVLEDKAQDVEHDKCRRVPKHSGSRWRPSPQRSRVRPAAMPTNVFEG